MAFVWSSPASHTAVIYGVSFVPSAPCLFLGLDLSFMALALVMSTDQLICRMSSFGFV